MEVVAISDQHGHLPAIPECDLLIIAGDICPATNHDLGFQRLWLTGELRRWLQAQPAKEIVGVWGNHDLVAEKQSAPPLPWTVLRDALTESLGYRIYGLPWQLRFFDWAFNLDELELDLKYQAIPTCDIIVSHGPAYGYGDRAPLGRAGSRAFLKGIDEIRPLLVVTGHTHCDPGVWTRGGTTIVNATLLDDDYRMVHSPRCLDLGRPSVMQ